MLPRRIFPPSWPPPSAPREDGGSKWLHDVRYSEFTHNFCPRPPQSASHATNREKEMELCICIWLAAMLDKPMVMLSQQLTWRDMVVTILQITSLRATRTTSYPLRRLSRGLSYEDGGWLEASRKKALPWLALEPITVVGSQTSARLRWSRRNKTVSVVTRGVSSAGLPRASPLCPVVTFLRCHIHARQRATEFRGSRGMSILKMFVLRIPESRFRSTNNIMFDTSRDHLLIWDSSRLSIESPKVWSRKTAIQASRLSRNVTTRPTYP